MVAQSPEWILSDQHACRRAIWALKAGRPPREGIRFLSVGVDRVLATVRSALQEAAAGRPVSLLIVRSAYGEGKSHTLRLIAEEAQEHRFAWVVVTFDREQQIGLHKPAWLFRSILWELRWNYPTIDLYRWILLNRKPSRFVDRQMRTELGRVLGHLAGSLRAQGFAGLVLCLDELENYKLLVGQQNAIFREVLGRLCEAPQPSIVLVLAMTDELYGLHVPGQVIDPPTFDDSGARTLAKRLYQLHGVAFDWRPPISPDSLASEASKRVGDTPSGRWRLFVQDVITRLEVLHQEEC